MDEDEFQEIEMLGDEFHHALLGAVFESDGTPVPCLSLIHISEPTRPY